LGVGALAHALLDPCQFVHCLPLRTVLVVRPLAGNLLDHPR
jgi:hypothetical protein